MGEVLTIANWSETFENAESRKLKRLGYFYAPTGVDSSGYLELMTEHGERGILALGVFQALCQITATFPKNRRGRFEKSDGRAMSLKQIAALIRMPETIVEDAVQLLCSQEIGWMILEISQQFPNEIPMKSQSDPTILGTERRGGDRIGEEKDRSVVCTVPEDCGTPDADPLPESEPTPIFSGGDSMKSQQAIIERVKRGLSQVNPDWLPHFTQMEMIDLSANLSLWAEIPRHYWLLMRWWYSKKRPALVRQQPTATHYPFAERAGLLKDTTRCLDAIADKWNRAGKPALEPRPKKAGKKPQEEAEEAQERDPLDDLKADEFDALKAKVQAGPLTEIDKAIMGSENKALANEHVRMLMREQLKESKAA